MFTPPDSRTLAPFIVSFFVVGCGLKAPLYLPDSAQHERIAAPAAPTEEAETSAKPASQSESPSQRERATDKAPASDTQTPVTPPDPDRPATIEPEPQSP